MKRLLNSLKNWIDTDRSDFIRTLLLSEGFGFCFFLCLIWGWRLDRYGSASKWLLPGLLISLLLGDILSDVLMCIWACRRERVSPSAKEHDSQDRGLPRNDLQRAVSRKVWLISSAVIFAAWIPVWLAYYPAVFAYDAETQLGQVISQIYSTHHPLLHTLIMGGCMKLMWSVGGINAGMALYAVLQMVFVVVVIGWIIAEAHRLGARRWMLCIYGVFCAIFPAHAILAVSTTKDVVFSALVPVFVLLIRRCVCEHERSHSSGNGGGGSHVYVLTGITAGVMILFRNNALYALVLTLIVMTIGYVMGRRSDRCKAMRFRPMLIVAILIGCIAGSLINGGLKLILHAESGSPREALSIPIQQMARVYVQHGDDLDAGLSEDLAVILGGSRDDTSNRYNEHLADPVKKQVYMKAPGRFIKTWLKLGVRYPGDYMDAWLYTTEGAWYIGDTSVDRIYGEGADTGFGYLSTDIRSMPDGFEVIPHSYLPGLKKALERLVSDNVFERVPVIRLIFSPALYVWILVTYAYVSSVRRDRTAFVVLLYPLAVYLTILMGPAVLVRYMYPYMLLVILPMLPVCASERGDEMI